MVLNVHKEYTDKLNLIDIVNNLLEKTHTEKFFLVYFKQLIWTPISEIITSFFSNFNHFSLFPLITLQLYGPHPIKWV